MFAHAQNPGTGKILDLDETLKVLGNSSSGAFELRWDPFLRAGVFSSGDHYAAFETGGEGELGLVLFDSREILTLPLPYTEQGALRFPETFVSRIRNTFNRTYQDELGRFRIAAIVVDPGHGGRDTGAIGTHTVNGKTFKSVEKDITLKVSKLLHTRLSAGFPDKKVLMTRTGDTFPSLETRVDMANSVPLKENEAVIYISLHANASFSKNARGYEIWYLNRDYRREVVDPGKYESPELVSILNHMLEEEFTTESIMVAKSIMNRINESLGKLIPSRGLKAEEWFVVRNARMPSVLVEMGFVTNLEDALLLNDHGYLQKLSEAIYKGIADFIALFERSGGFTAIP
jgi:N-acetylmuramoyl-L-alanine amidase